MESRIYLPRVPNWSEPPRTVLEYLVRRFPHIDAQIWRERSDKGQIRFEDGAVLEWNTPYHDGLTVVYPKEIPNEPCATESEIIVFQDENIIVVDKPHGMVVTPAGDQVERSLLVRLRRLTGFSDLTPVHRLDRDTAGIVLFAIHGESRHRYHQLFEKKLVEREYRAAALVESVVMQRTWDLANRMEPGEPWYRQQISTNSAPVNAVTRIELLECRSDLGLFALKPETGKKHQLRVHMTSIGYPIFGDLLYPEIREAEADEIPLQLLAYRLAFVDPVSGEPRNFRSVRTLKLMPPLHGTTG